jgi:hypothetical protein
MATPFSASRKKRESSSPVPTISSSLKTTTTTTTTTSRAGDCCAKKRRGGQAGTIEPTTAAAPAVVTTPRSVPQTPNSIDHIQEKSSSSSEVVEPPAEGFHSDLGTVGTTTTTTTTPAVTAETTLSPVRRQPQPQPLVGIDSIETALQRVVHLTSKHNCSSCPDHDDNDDCREYLDKDRKYCFVLRLATTTDQRVEFAKYMMMMGGSGSGDDAAPVVDDCEPQQDQQQQGFVRLTEALDGGSCCRIMPSSSARNSSSPTTSPTRIPPPVFGTAAAPLVFALLGYRCSVNDNDDDDDEDVLSAVALVSLTLNQQLERTIYVETIRADSDLLRRRMWLRIALLASYANCPHILTSKKTTTTPL